MNESTGSAESRDTPYFGLDYYQEKFGAWFFGRETEGSKIITNLRAARLTLLYAGSGVGKSSLLRAGVAWRMRRLADDSLARRGTARFVPVVFSSWKDDPVLELMNAIGTAIGPYLAGRPQPELPAGRLDAAIGAASDAVNAGLLIMLDQFEEYFLYRAREPVPGRFADELARCINRAGLRANFLIAIREDAYAGLGDLFKGQIGNVYGNYLHIDYLDRASAEKAIREPLDVYNGQPGVDHVKIQDELVAAVLDQVRATDGDMPLGQAAAADGGGDGRVATRLLQLVMETLWEQERAQGSHELRLSTLQDLRGVGMIVEAHLWKALSALGSGERQTAIDVFGHLVTPSGGKIAESVSDLAQVTGHSEGQVGSVLDRLDHERIVRPVPAAPGQDPARYRRYEIFHDVLAPAVNRTIAVREERRRTRRFRRLTALAAALLIAVLAVAGGFAYLWQKASAEESAANAEKLTAESRLLAAIANEAVAEAGQLQSTDPSLAAQLELVARHLDPTPSNTSQLLDTANIPLSSPLTGPTGPVDSVAFSPDGHTLAAGSDDGTIWLWNVTDPAHPTQIGQPLAGPGDAVDSVAFSPDGHTLAAGSDDDTIWLWNVTDPLDATQIGQPLTGPGSTVESVAFSPDGHTLAAGSYDGTSRLWNVTDPAYASPIGQPLTAVAGTVWSVAFSPDGHTLAAAGNDGTIRLWDLDVDDAVNRICATTSGNLTPGQWARYIPQLPYDPPCHQ